MQFKDNGGQCVGMRGHTGPHLPERKQEPSPWSDPAVAEFAENLLKDRPVYGPGQTEPRKAVLPTDAAARNEYPMAEGLLYYFPAALAEIARVSKIGNDQHNPGEPMYWARGKSTDHANKVIKHLVDAGLMDTDGTRHTAKAAWRILAMLQEEMEQAGAPKARNAR
jgi:hypothetical protein